MKCIMKRSKSGEGSYVCVFSLWQDVKMIVKFGLRSKNYV